MTDGKARERFKPFKDAAFEDCRILYRGRHRPATESLMCFGWECPDAWNELLRDLSYRLEAVNVWLYPKYRVRIEAEQVKEKFGTLRFYYHVATDLPYPVRCWSEWAGMAARQLARADFGYKRVIDRPARTGYDFREIPAEEYATRTAPDAPKCVNAFYFERGGRFYEMTKLSRIMESHAVPTKRRLRYAAMKALRWLSTRLDFSPYWPRTAAQRVMAEYAGSLAESYVREAERRTEQTCASCGRQIGTEWSPACVTKGWITYLCESCAKADGHGYEICGKKEKEIEDNNCG